jgi:hypothetical protein
VRLFEDVLTLHAEADERVHVEEAAIPELLVGRLPVREAIVLLVQEVVEGIVVPVQFGDGAVDPGAGGGFLGAEAAEQAVEDGLVAMAGEDEGAVGRRRRRES